MNIDMKIEPTYISVDEWRARFYPAPHRNVVLRWIKQGYIVPSGKFIGRRWYLHKDAEYVRDVPPAD